jgi:hypothetical protein
MLAAVVLLAISAFGCAVREYHYTATAPDGSQRTIDIRITNSDVSVGELAVETADGGTLMLSDLSAEERTSRAIEAAAEAVKAAAGMVP